MPHGTEDDGLSPDVVGAPQREKGSVDVLVPLALAGGTEEGDKEAPPADPDAYRLLRI